jgi:hypothetical protein
MSLQYIQNEIDKTINSFYFYITSTIFDKKNIFNDDFLTKNLTNIVDFAESIDLNKLRELVTLEDNVVLIWNTIVKYIVIYFMTFVMVTHDSNILYHLLKIKANNISTLTPKLTNIIDEITSDDVMRIKNIYEIVLKMQQLLQDNLTDDELQTYAKNDKYKWIMRKINELGNEYVTSYFKSSNKQDNIHNMIKTMMLIEIYDKHDKIKIFRIIEEQILNKSEYIYIDVVLSKNSVVTFDVIDSILTEKEKRNNCAHYIYEGINEINNVSSMMTSFDNIDNKIESLFSTKFVVPIVDNILLYHKNNEKYLSQSKIMKKNKEVDATSQTKIGYITEKISNAMNNENLNWYLPDQFSNYLSINQYENMNIYNKLSNYSTENTNQNNSQLFLDTYSKAYIDFVNQPTRIEFKFVPNKTIDIIKKNKTKLIHCLTASQFSSCNVTGLLFKPYDLQLECIKTSDVAIESVTDIFGSFDIFNENQTLSHALYFSNNDELLKIVSQYENVDNVNNTEIAKIIAAFVYDKLSEILLKNLTKQIKKSTKIQLQQLNKILKFVNDNVLMLSNKSTNYFDFLKAIHNKIAQNKILKHISTKIMWNFEKLIDSKLRKPIMSHINTFNIKTNKSGIVQLNTQIKNNDHKFNDDAQCQHEIEWNDIRQLKKYESSKYTNMYEKYLEKFLVVNKDNEYCCKSCGNKLGIENYDVSGQFDDETNQFIVFGSTMVVNLADLPEYSNLKLSIDFISSILERLILMADLHAFGKRSIITNLTKNIIDTIIKNNFALIQNQNKSQNKIQNKSQNKDQHTNYKYGILPAIYDNFVIGFDFSDNIYDKSLVTLNTQLIKNFIVAYCIAILLLKLNDFNINNFVVGSQKSKKGYCTFETFENMMAIIKNNYIVVNKNGDVDKIENYILFAYTIYYFSCLCVQYNLWSFPDKNSKMPIKIKIVFDTVLCAINTIVTNGINKPEDVSLSTYKNLFFVTLNKIYGSKMHVSNVKTKFRKTKRDSQETDNIQTKLQFEMNPKKFKHQSTYLKFKFKKNAKMSMNQLIEDRKIAINMNAINEMLVKANEKHKIILKSSKDNDEFRPTFTIVNTKINTIDQIISENKDLAKSIQNDQIKQFVNVVENILGFNVSEINGQVGKTTIEIYVDNNDNLLKKPIVITENINKSTTFYEKTIQINGQSTFVYVYENANVKQYFDYKNRTLIGITSHGKFERIVSKHVYGLKIYFDLEYQLNMLGFDNMIEENKSVTDIFAMRLIKIKQIFMLLHQVLMILSNETSKREFDEQQLQDSQKYKFGFKPNSNDMINVPFLKQLLIKYTEYNLTSLKNKIVNLFDATVINAIHNTNLNSTSNSTSNSFTNAKNTRHNNSQSNSQSNSQYNSTSENNTNNEIESNKFLSEKDAIHPVITKMDNIVHLDKNGNLLIHYFLFKLLELIQTIQKNESKIILKIVIDIISFYDQTTNSIYFNHDLKITKYRLDASLLHEELSGSTTDMINTTFDNNDDNETKSEIESDNNPDDIIEGAEDAYDTDGEFDYEGMYEQNDK